MLGSGAVRCSVACDVWDGIACVVLRRWSGWRGRAELGGAEWGVESCRLGDGLLVLGSAVAVKPLALIWGPAQMDILTIRGDVAPSIRAMAPGYSQ